MQLQSLRRRSETANQFFALSLSLVCVALLTGCWSDVSRGEQLNEVVIEGDGKTKFVAEIWTDNWFSMHVNGKPLHEDSVPYKTERSFNAERVTFSASFPMTLSFEFRDFMENDTGLEYIGSRRQQMGDGGAIVQMRRARVDKPLITSNGAWKCLVVHRAPLDRACVDVKNPAVGIGACLAKISTLPDGWTRPDFNDGKWPNATVHSKSAVSPKFGYDRVDWNSDAKFIWGPDLQRDNIVLCRVKLNAPS